MNTEPRRHLTYDVPPQGCVSHVATVHQIQYCEVLIFAPRHSSAPRLSFPLSAPAPLWRVGVL
jgi:hypothetical protein